MALKPLLEIQDLHVSFGPVQVANGVHLTVGEGEFLALVGESGCGKSVTALSVTGLLPDSARIKGKILFRGKDLLALSENELRPVRGGEIAYIFQEPATSLNPVLTVGDQIGEVLQFHRGLSKGDIQKEVVSLLAKVGIGNPEERFRAYPHELSGGMKQRVMIAMVIASRPKLIIADEPTTALDVTVQKEILSLLLDLKRELNLALLFITHDLSVVFQSAEKVAIMYCGKVVEQGKTVDVLTSPLHPYTLGLIRCVPKPGLRKSELPVIPGSVPNPVMLPTGCHFHPRCSFKVPRCEKEYPPVEETKPAHEVRCFEAEKVATS